MEYWSQLSHLYGEPATIPLKSYSDVVSQVPKEDLMAMILIGEEKYFQVINGDLEIETALFEIETILND